jgi:hypothetical protein
MNHNQAQFAKKRIASLFSSILIKTWNSCEFSFLKNIYDAYDEK